MSVNCSFSPGLTIKNSPNHTYQVIPIYFFYFSTITSPTRSKLTQRLQNQLTELIEELVANRSPIDSHVWKWAWLGSTEIEIIFL